MKAIAVICIAILEFVVFPASEGYEIIYPYGYVDPMMRSDYESPPIQPPTSRLLLAPLANFFFKECPSNVIGGHVIGNVCFTVNTTPQTFAAALASCQTNGGTLAQPAPVPALSKTFYAALKSKFRIHFAAVEAAAANPGIFWIGYMQAAATAVLPAGPFMAQDWTGKFAAGNNAIFVPAVAGNAVPLAAAIVNPGATWQALVPTILLPFICQYTLVA